MTAAGAHGYRGWLDGGVGGDGATCIQVEVRMVEMREVSGALTRSVGLRHDFVA